MMTDTADDMLLDASLPTTTPLASLAPTSGAPDTGVSSAPETIPLPPAADLAIQMPDEAALAAAAAAAAVAAAAQDGIDVTNQHEVPEHAVNGTDDLNSYLLAAAAASVHAQQQSNGDDPHKTQSEESFDSTATPVPNSVYTNGTSVNGSEEDDVRAAIHEQCHRYTDDRAPFPISIGKRTPGGCAEYLAATPSAAEQLEQLPLTEANVGLGKTRCYWALLSADHSRGSVPTGEKLHFVYLDPVLQQHMAEQAGSMIGSDFYDYVHPEERDRVSDDMQKIVDSRTLFGSVTRCRYSRIPRIRELLGAVNPPRDPEADRYVEDDSFVAIDIVINWIGDGMLLCFFHAIIDKTAEDNDEQHKSDWTNWCGTPAGSFTLRQCDLIWKQVKATPRETVAETGPVHVFQVIEAGGVGKVLLSWPPPRLFSRDVEPHLVTQSDTTIFHDGSYFADDFARLAQGVSITPGSSSLSDANTSCTRRFRAKHTLTTEGKVRSIESVLIPYGGVILACFHTTFQQQLPLPDPKLMLQAQPERRKAEDEASQESPNKRQRTDHALAQDDTANSALQMLPNGAVAQPTVPASASAAAQSKSPAIAASPLPPPTPRLQDHASAAVNGARPQASTPGVKTANGHTSKPPSSKYTKSLVKNESGLAALANPSLMYTNAPTKPPAAHTNGTRPAAERATASLAQNHASGLPAVAVAPSAGDSPGSSQDKACTGCGKINSPEWRRGPSGHKTLCNACGLRYARSLTRRKKKKGKDGQVEFIEPTGDPTVVPKSRGGGGGSLPGVHRKNSKKRKEEEAAKAAAAATVAATSQSTLTEALTATPATASASSATSPSSVSATQSPAPAAPTAKSTSPSLADLDKPVASEDVAAAPVAVKLEQSDDGEAGLSTTEATTDTSVATDPANSVAVSIALDAIAHATSAVPSLDTDALSLPISNAINRAIAATLGSTDAGAASGGLITSQALSDAPSVTMSITDDPASAELDPNVSAAALKTIESVVSEALFKQLVTPGLTETSPAADAVPVANVPAASVDEGGTSDASTAPGLDLSHALTADAIRAAAQAAIAQGVGTEEHLIPQSD